MITPDYLKPGDKVGLIATARFVKETELDGALELLRSWGLQVVFAPNITTPYHQFAGDDASRAAGLQDMLDDPEIKALWCVRGGYGSIRLLDLLNFEKFKSKPKWIVGYSDVTVFHNVAHNLGIKSIHGTMPIDLASKKSAMGNAAGSIDALRDVLFGRFPDLDLESTANNRTGSGQGVITGGNLSMLYSMCGSPYQVDTTGKILVLEDLDEYLYHIDRMMQNLKNNGLLRDLAGLLVGGFTKIHDNSTPFGKSAKEIILEQVERYDYPVAFDWPIGHIFENHPHIFGHTARFEVTPQGVSLNYL